MSSGGAGRGAILGGPPASGRTCANTCFQDGLRNQQGPLFWKLHTTPAQGPSLRTGSGPRLPPLPQRCRCWVSKSLLIALL